VRAFLLALARHERALAFVRLLAFFLLDLAIAFLQLGENFDFDFDFDFEPFSLPPACGGHSAFSGFPGGPVCSWFLSPQPLPGRVGYCD